VRDTVVRDTVVRDTVVRDTVVRDTVVRDAAVRDTAVRDTVARPAVARSHDTILWGLATGGAVALTVALVAAVGVATASVREQPHLPTLEADRRRPGRER
jgi:hypothetical protein